VPRFAGASNAAGWGGVRDSEEVIERVDFDQLERLVRSVGGNLWRGDGELYGHKSAGDYGGRSCLGDSSGRDKIPRAGDSAGARGSLRRDSGGDDLDGRHFAEWSR
jgi:hypothetical protein